MDREAVLISKPSCVNHEHSTSSSPSGIPTACKVCSMARAVFSPSSTLAACKAKAFSPSATFARSNASSRRSIRSSEEEKEAISSPILSRYSISSASGSVYFFSSLWRVANRCLHASSRDGLNSSVSTYCSAKSNRSCKLTCAEVHSSR